MTEHDPFDALDPTLPAEEQAELAELTRHLIAERPVPRAGFRAELRAQIAGAAGPALSRPRRLRAAVLGYAVAGLLLLGVAGVGVAGSGPLAPSSAPAAQR